MGRLGGGSGSSAGGSGGTLLSTKTGVREGTCREGEGGAGAGSKENIGAEGVADELGDKAVRARAELVGWMVVRVSVEKDTT